MGSHNVTQTLNPALDRRRLDTALADAMSTYVERNPASRALFERAGESLPGGNTRTGVFMDPFPLYADRGEGVHLYDVDAHRLLDFVNNNSALILGHAHPRVVEALQKQIPRGTGFSRPLAAEVEMAELLRERIPSLELKEIGSIRGMLLLLVGLARISRAVREPEAETEEPGSP